MKACYEFGNDPIKICFEHKTRKMVDHRIKNVKIVQNCVNVDCDF